MTILASVNNKTVMPGITPIADVPDAPTIGTATAAGLAASVTFTAATTGGTPTTYTATSNPGSITGTSATSPITVSGLTGDTSYTFTVTAGNSTGTSAASSASNSITAVDPVSGGYDSLATVIVPSGGLSSIVFAGIPTGYKHLEIRMSPQSNRGTYGTDNIALRINGDSTTSYAYHYLRGSGSAVAAASSTSGTEITEFTTQGCGTSTGGTFGAGVATILDYASTTKYKTVRNLSGVDLNGAVGGGYGYVSLVSGLWMNTAAITSLLFYPVNGTAFTANSSFALYGVK